MRVLFKDGTSERYEANHWYFDHFRDGVIFIEKPNGKKTVLNFSNVLSMEEE